MAERQALHLLAWPGAAQQDLRGQGSVPRDAPFRATGPASLLRLAAVDGGPHRTALGAFYRRLSARVGKAKAVTATARKIAVLFYNALRHGMDYADPGASYYEERYQQRVLANLQRRAKSLGYVLQQADTAPAAVGVSEESCTPAGNSPATTDSDEEPDGGGRLPAAGGGLTAAACDALGVARATVYRQRARRAGPLAAPPASRPPRALTAEERQTVLDLLREPRFADLAPAEIYATLLDEGIYHCSIRTMYRILDDHDEVRERRDQLRHPVYTKPELLAEGPNQVWSWDITKLMGPAKWTYDRSC